MNYDIWINIGKVIIPLITFGIGWFCRNTKEKFNLKIEARRQIIEILHKLSLIFAKYNIFLNIDEIDIVNENKTIINLFNDLHLNCKTHKGFFKISDKKIEFLSDKINKFTISLSMINMCNEDIKKYTHNGSFPDSELANETKRDKWKFIFDVKNNDDCLLNLSKVILKTIMEIENGKKIKNSKKSKKR